MYRLLSIALISLAILAAACGSSAGTASSGKPIKSGPAGNDLTVTLGNSDGLLKKGKQTFTLTFANAAGKPVDVGSASLNFFMPAMGSMSAMNSSATLVTTSTPGLYSATADIEMSGDWQAQIKYDGPAGKGSATLTVTAQ
jgi:hypothetical protein